MKDSELGACNCWKIRNPNRISMSIHRQSLDIKSLWQCRIRSQYSLSFKLLKGSDYCDTFPSQWKLITTSEWLLSWEVDRETLNNCQIINIYGGWIICAG